MVMQNRRLNDYCRYTNPLIDGRESVSGSSSASIDTLDVANLPKVVKEKDIEYQVDFSE